jgi:Peroxidase
LTQFVDTWSSESVRLKGEGWHNLKILAVKVKMWKSTSLLVLAYALLQLALVKACPYLASLDGDEAPSRGVNAVSSAAKQNATSKRADRRLGTSVSSNSLFGPFTSFLNSIRKVPRTQAQALKLARNDIETIISSNMGIEAKFVRLVFHDCVGDCDGCVDLTDKNNNGLDIPINALVPTVAKYKKFLTRGDVWMLAGLVAAEVSQQGTTVSFDMEFVGRPNCAANEPNGGPVRALPSAQFNTAQVLDYFKTNFGFSNRETVAILGAHTLYVWISQQVRFELFKR